MTDEELVAFNHAGLPTFPGLPGGRITAFDTLAQTCTCAFKLSTESCHPVARLNRRT